MGEPSEAAPPSESSVASISAIRGKGKTARRKWGAPERAMVFQAIKNFGNSVSGALAHLKLNYGEVFGALSVRGWLKVPEPLPGASAVDVVNIISGILLLLVLFFCFFCTMLTCLRSQMLRLQLLLVLMRVLKVSLFSLFDCYVYIFISCLIFVIICLQVWHLQAVFLQASSI